MSFKQCNEKYRKKFLISDAFHVFQCFKLKSILFKDDGKRKAFIFFCIESIVLGLPIIENITSILLENK
jgi:hypothetical protein